MLENGGGFDSFGCLLILVERAADWSRSVLKTLDPTYGDATKWDHPLTFLDFRVSVLALVLCFLPTLGASLDVAPDTQETS